MAAMLQRGSTTGPSRWRRAIDLDTSDPWATAHHAGDCAELQPGALCLRRLHHRGRKFCRVDLGGGFGRAETLVYVNPVGQPIDLLSTGLPPEAHRPAIGRERAIAPVVADFFDEPPMQGKAAPRERL